MTGYQKLKAEKGQILEAVKEARDKLINSHQNVPVIEQVSWLLDAILIEYKK